MAEYGTLLQDLTNNITLEDLEQLKSACKEDIPSEKSEEITTGSAWFSFLESHNKLDKGRGPGGQASYYQSFRLSSLSRDEFRAPIHTKCTPLARQDRRDAFKNVEGLQGSSLYILHYAPISKNVTQTLLCYYHIYNKILK